MWNRHRLVILMFTVSGILQGMYFCSLFPEYEPPHWLIWPAWVLLLLAMGFGNWFFIQHEEFYNIVLNCGRKNLEVPEYIHLVESEKTIKKWYDEGAVQRKACLSDELETLRKAADTFKVLQSMTPEEQLAYGERLKQRTISSMQDNVNIEQFLEMTPLEYYKDDLEYYRMSIARLNPSR